MLVEAADIIEDKKCSFSSNPLNYIVSGDT